MSATWPAACHQVPHGPRDDSHDVIKGVAIHRMVRKDDQWYPHPAISPREPWQIQANHHHRFGPVVIAWDPITMHAPSHELLHLQMLLHPCHVLLASCVQIVTGEQHCLRTQIPDHLQHVQWQ